MVNARIGGRGDPPETDSLARTPSSGHPFSPENVARHQQELGKDVRGTITGQLAALKRLGGSADEAHALVETVFSSSEV